VNDCGARADRSVVARLREGVWAGAVSLFSNGPEPHPVALSALGQVVPAVVLLASMGRRPSVLARLLLNHILVHTKMPSELLKRVELVMQLDPDGAATLVGRLGLRQDLYRGPCRFLTFMRLG
jgi:hypothetical protein